MKKRSDRFLMTTRRLKSSNIAQRHHLPVGTMPNVAQKRSRYIILRESTDGRRQMSRSLLGVISSGIREPFSSLVSSHTGPKPSIVVVTGQRAVSVPPQQVVTQAPLYPVKDFTALYKCILHYIILQVHQHQTSNLGQHQVFPNSRW